jgi:hypothetical protein
MTPKTSFGTLFRSKLRCIFGNYSLFAASIGEVTPKEIKDMSRLQINRQIFFIFG